ncbi:MAG: tetratricopeptide repeat protein, partial [Chloroflexota bacterium]
MSEDQDKLHRNGSQKPNIPESGLPRGFSEEDAQVFTEVTYHPEEEGEEDEERYDPYALAQQLTSSPLFAQVQAMLGGGGGVEARMSAARIQQATGDLEGAAETYLDIIEEDPTHQKAHVALGQVLMMMDRVQEAEIFLGKAVDLEPEDPS